MSVPGGDEGSKKEACLHGSGAGGNEGGRGLSDSVRVRQALGWERRGGERNGTKGGQLKTLQRCWGTEGFEWREEQQGVKGGTEGCASVGTERRWRKGWGRPGLRSAVAGTVTGVGAKGVRCEMRCDTPGRGAGARWGPMYHS